MENIKFKWTEEKVMLLRQYYPILEWDKLYEILDNYNKMSIVSRASKLKISRDIYNNCHRADDEIKYICDHAHEMSASQIGKHLKRPTQFVLRIMQEHGLELYQSSSRLHKEDEKLFKEIYPIYTNKYLSEKFFPYLNTRQLRSQAKRFGLVKNSDKSVKWYDKENLLDQLEHVIREMGRVPMLTELQEHGLPSEKTFTRYFGGLTKACEMIGVERPNYSGHKFYFDKNHNLCLSKVELDISNFLIDNNFSFIKEYNYSNVMPIEQCGQRRFDWKIGDKYIEYFGLIHLSDYRQDSQFKIKLCNQYNISLLALYPKNIYQSKDWQQLILNYLK